MNRQLLKHKGYSGSIDVSLEDSCLFGEVLFIKDTVVYHGATLSELSEAFKEAVEQYIADCNELGRDPNKPFSGSFNVRVKSETHRELALLAFRRGESLNQIVSQACDNFIRVVEFAQNGKLSLDITHHHKVQCSISQEVGERMPFKKEPTWRPQVVA